MSSVAAAASALRLVSRTVNVYGYVTGSLLETCSVMVHWALVEVKMPSARLLAILMLLLFTVANDIPFRPGAVGSAQAAAHNDAMKVQPSEAAGEQVAGLEAFDRIVADLLAHWQIPGGSLAIAKDGRLVLARGYGLADVAANQPVQSDSLFRVASVSKPITAVAILKLVDDRQLDLDARAFEVLDYLLPTSEAIVDSRIRAITVRQLLQHTAGWDRRRSGDPMFLPASRRAALTVGTADPPDCATIIRYMLGRPLDFEPGTEVHYSNFGYCILGRIIEKVSGLPYEEYVKTEVLAPLGITAIRLGHTRLDQRAEGEVRYYGPPGAAPVPSVFPGEPVGPVAYGGYYLEAMDAHGGWLASAVDLVRFATGIDGQRAPALLRPETVRLMLLVPLPRAAGGDGTTPTSGLAWQVEPARPAQRPASRPTGTSPGGPLSAGNGLDWSHGGVLPATSAAWRTRTHDGVTIACAFNSVPSDMDAFISDVIGRLRTAAAQVAVWPADDLFERR
jgi:N-acyl-D-amino-acid deacylase